MPFNKSFNLPTILTLTRLILATFIFPVILFYFLPLNIPRINFLLGFFFALLCMTDFFDGYLARKYKLVTKFGKALDQIADKFLVTSTLITLLAINKINYFWVIILISRELFVMGLREIALENNRSISVSFYGKLKTTFQMLMLFLIILNPHKDIIFMQNIWDSIEIFLIILTVFLSIYSAIQYYRSIFRKMN